MGGRGDRIGSIVLDAGPLIAFERGEGAARAVVEDAINAQLELVISAGVLAQVWRSPRQARLARLLPEAFLEPLGLAAARACGELLSRTGTSDVVDAHVALCALKRPGSVIVTSDPAHLATLAPGTTLRRV